MTESFVSALYRQSPRDAVLNLHMGTVDFSFDDSPSPVQRQWLAELIDSEWGLSSRLGPALTFSSRWALVVAAEMCRRSASHSVPPKDWWLACKAVREARLRSAALWGPVDELVLAVIEEITVEHSATDAPDLSATVALSFEALGYSDVAPADSVRQWLVCAVVEHASMLARFIASEERGSHTLPAFLERSAYRQATG